MSQGASSSVIRLKGVRQNTLKGFDLDIPMRKLIVVTGLSGSGKSSLAFDTLYAEGQRRYIETFSPYARQFFDRMDKPRVDSIEGIPPAIALEQRNTVKTTRSTVGTMTEVCDYMKVLWPHMAQLTCRGCGKPVHKDSPGSIWEEWAGEATGSGFGETALPVREALVLFDVPLATGFGVEESLQFIRKQAYSRLWIDDEVVRLEDVPARLKARAPAFLTVVQDRLKFDPVSKRRGVEAFEQAFHFGKGKIALKPVGGGALRRYSNHLHCAACDISYREPSPALFSFNNPVGACPTCKGFGRVVTIDYESAIPNRSLTLAQGAVKPWQTATGKESQQDMTKFCKTRKVPMDVPFEKLSAAHQKWVMDGDPDYGKDAAHQWPKAWYGVKGYFRWMESQSYKMHMRVLLSRYRAYVTCESCKGLRFQPEALQYRVAVPNGPAMALPEYYRLTVSGARAWIDDSAARTLGKGSMAGPVELALKEVRSRLAYLEEVGLGYLTLDRSTRSLSGGETQRVNLTTCLGSRLVNTLFVLDEPSVGLHARDTARLVGILHRLRDSGNTLVVVEHEASVMRSADQIIDLGPGHGEQGGELIFQGTADEIIREPKSITGRYLSQGTGFAASRLSVDEKTPRLILSGATLHNLNNLTVSLPLARLVCITGVSGSGKTTLVRHILHPALVARLNSPASVTEAAESDAEDEEQEGGSASRAVRVTGHESLGSVLMVDQSSLGRTPRSNPVVYIGAFDHVRDLFAEAPLASQRGLSAGSFSFNSAQGQCDRCRGAGFEKIEMQFLSDIFVRCPDCQGRRYRSHVLEIKLDGGGREWSIADLLEATADDAVAWLRTFADSKFAARAIAPLEILCEVGLGYLRLGQPVNTLSGGECQRLKLASHLAEHQAPGAGEKRSLFIFDEPTTGLHFEDVRILVQALRRMVTAGHSVLVVEHNLQLIAAADWVVDLGPDAGSEGGLVVCEGTPATVSKSMGSHTASALRAEGQLISQVT